MSPAGKARSTISPPGGEKLRRVADQVSQHLHQAPLDRPDQERALGHVERQARLAVVAGRVVDLGQRGQDRRHIDRLGRRARQLGIDPARVADVADQPVQAAHVVADDGEQPPLLPGVLHPAQRLDRAADGAERVLDLVRHVRGEPLRRVHARPQGAGAFGQRVGQLADLVSAGEQAVGHGAGPALALAHRARRVREAQDRPGDGEREIPRQPDREHEGQGEQLQDAHADREQAVIHLARLAREQHDAEVRRLRRIGSDTLTSSRPSAVRRM